MYMKRRKEKNFLGVSNLSASSCHFPQVVLLQGLALGPCFSPLPLGSILCTAAFQGS